MKTTGNAQRKEVRHNTAAAAEWNRTGYNYSALWHMYDQAKTVLHSATRHTSVAR